MLTVCDWWIGSFTKQPWCFASSFSGYEWCFIAIVSMVVTVIIITINISIIISIITIITTFFITIITYTIANAIPEALTWATFCLSVFLGCLNLFQSSKDIFLAAYDGEDLHEQAQKANPQKGNFYKMSKEVYCIIILCYSELYSVLFLYKYRTTSTSHAKVYWIISHNYCITLCFCLCQICVSSKACPRSYFKSPAPLDKRYDLCLSHLCPVCRWSVA